MYDHYVAVDWAQSNMAIGRMTQKSQTAKITEANSDIRDLKAYLNSLRGSKILAIEETTTAHWLYTELRDHVDDLIVCDPYRNRLLSEGAKNDRIDAAKLVTLLRSNLLKPVFHSSDRFIEMRKLVSAYNDLVQRGVRLKNQKSAVLRASGKDKDCEDYANDRFILDRIDAAIDSYEGDKLLYVREFEKISRRELTIRRLRGLPGIGLIGSIKIAAIIVDAGRFRHRNNFLSYCGLVRLEKLSGGRSYGSRLPRYRRELKTVFKTAALSAIGSDNCFREEYLKLMKDLSYSEAKARHAVARRIATAALGMMLKGEKFDPGKVRQRFRN